MALGERLSGSSGKSQMVRCHFSKVRSIGRARKPGATVDIMPGSSLMSPGASRRGQLRRADYEKVRDDLIAGLNPSRTKTGETLARRCFVQRISPGGSRCGTRSYRLFRRLYWRSVGTIGGGKLHTFETTPARRCEPRRERHHPLAPCRWRSPGGRRVDGARITDVAPTVLELLNFADSRRHGGQATC